MVFTRSDEPLGKRPEQFLGTSHKNTKKRDRFKKHAKKHESSFLIKLLRMRDSYKRFVKTWIRFANPWICFVSFRDHES